MSMKEFINFAITNNKNSVALSIIVKENLIGEFHFDANDISYADDGELYIKYDGVDMTIPTADTEIIYDEEWNTFEIKDEDVVYALTF